MYPSIVGLPSYFLMWALSPLATVPLGLARIRHGNAGPIGRGIVAGCLLFSIVFVGAKLLFFAEAAWFPEDDYVPEAMRGPLHGFRIPGGVAALALALPLVVRLFGLPPAYADRFIPIVPVAIAFVRVGCFLNGCCFGYAADLPWALTFPRESWVFLFQVERAGLPATSPHPLPVHPLQLYLLLASLGTLAALLVYERCRLYREGDLPWLFFLLFFGSTALLEPLRANPLSLNHWIVLPGILIPASVLVFRHHLAATPPVVRCAQ